MNGISQRVVDEVLGAPDKLAKRQKQVVIKGSDSEGGVLDITSYSVSLATYAAAPELLAALQAMFSEHGEFDYSIAMLSNARAAIAKATGSQP